MEKRLMQTGQMVLAILAVFFFIFGVGWMIVDPTTAFVGYALLGVSGLFLINMILLQKLTRKMATQEVISGEIKQAVIVDVVEDITVTVNKKHPYYLVCELENKKILSDYFYDDVNYWKNQKTVNVVVDQHDVKVDLSKHEEK